MTALVMRGDAGRLPLADSSVDLIVTSPPYFGLRSYQDGGQHYVGQVGDETTPQEFVNTLLSITAECSRVLKPSGSIWVNLGDKMCADNRGSGTDDKRGEAKHAPAGPAGYPGEGFVRRKSLMGLPWRYALGCIDQLGLILRAEVIWSKPNGMPESVTDRVRRSHETWFHFTKEPRYFSAVDEVRERSLTAPRYPQRAGGRSVPGLPAQSNLGAGGSHLTEANYNPLGKLPGSVWTVATEPLNVPASLGIDHFAAFPTEWPRRIIRGWSPAGICVECREGRRPVSSKVLTNDRGGDTSHRHRSAIGGGDVGTLGWERTVTITGHACACPLPDAPTRPAVVLDPFGGTGTTALVAATLGRIGVSVDLSHDYSRLARWRTTDPGERARAMRVDKPPVQVDGQADLFGEVAS